MHARTYTFTGPSSSRATDCQRDSHHELLEKSIEYKKSPWCVRRVGSLSPSPPSSFPSLSFSLSLSLFLPLPPSRPPSFLPLLPHLSRARARAVSVFARDKERASSRVYTNDRRRWAIRVHARRPRTEIRTREGSRGDGWEVHSGCTRERDAERIR